MEKVLQKQKRKSLLFIVNAGKEVISNMNMLISKGGSNKCWEYISLVPDLVAVVMFVWKPVFRLIDMRQSY